MNVLAILMVISLIMIVITSFDPRFASAKEIKLAVIRIGVGIVLGFLIMLLYGLGMPGLRYFFMITGIGGLAHLFLTRKSQTSSSARTETLPI